MTLRLLRNQKFTNTWFIQSAIRKVYPIGKICSVHRGPLKGLRFRVTRAMGFTYAWGIGVEQWEFSGLVQPGMCVYDIGANCGQSTLSLARLVGTSGQVIAFEPVDCLFDNLVYNIKLNPSLNVMPVCAAAFQRNGQVDFHFNCDLVTQGHVINAGSRHSLPNKKTISVRAIRLDDYRSENWLAPQFMKIDVEGGADAVLSGSQSLIEEHRPIIYIELHGPEEQNAVRDLLTTFRYKAQTQSGLEVPDPTAGWFNPLICTPR
jgi:FkbM family methyltransferase